MVCSKMVALTILIMIMVFPIVFANAISEASELVWEKTYGTGNSDAASCVIQTTDGGYALIGAIGHGYFPSIVLLVKTNVDSEIQWNKTFDDLSSPCAIVQTADDGYVFAGASETGIVLSKTDSKGNTQWTQNYTVPFEGSSGGDPLSLIQTKDGGYAVVGACQVYL
jgi:hypothetical protein